MRKMVIGRESRGPVDFDGVTTFWNIDIGLSPQVLYLLSNFSIGYDSSALIIEMFANDTGLEIFMWLGLSVWYGANVDFCMLLLPEDSCDLKGNA